MNKLTLIIFLLFLSTTVWSQGNVVDTKKHRILMQFTEGDSLEQAAVIGQIGNIREAFPNASIEVVCHSGGLDLLTLTKSKAKTAVRDFAAQGVVFAACNNTMKRRKLTKDDLLPQAVVVPSAMAELVLKQEKGWTYVKGAH